MKLSSVERLDIKELAFYRMTGLMAPGKDCSPHGNHPEFEVRDAAYRVWTQAYGECVQAVLSATEYVIRDPEEEA